MDTLNKLALDLFESKESYTTNDYLTIMNILKLVVSIICYILRCYFIIKII